MLGLFWLLYSLTSDLWWIIVYKPLVWCEWIVKVKSLSRVPTLRDPMDCSLPGSSVHGIFQARVLEWVTVSFSRRSSRPRDWTRVSHIVGRCFTTWATRGVSEFNFFFFFKVFSRKGLLLFVMPWIVFRFSNNSEHVHINYSFHLLILNRKKELCEILDRKIFIFNL